MPAERSPDSSSIAERYRRGEFSGKSGGRSRPLFKLLFGLIYLVSIVVACASGGGSTLEAGLGAGLIFGTFGFFITYPLILLFQHGLVFVVGKFRGRPVDGHVVWEYIPCLLVSLLFLSAPLFPPRSPESYYRRFVADTVPASVSDIRFYYRKGFGNSSWVVIFRIAAEDFDAVLSKYPYEEKVLFPGEDPWIPDGIGDYPKEPMVHCYVHSVPGPGGGLWVRVYSNKNKSLVYLLGSYD